MIDKSIFRVPPLKRVVIPLRHRQIECFRFDCVLPRRVVRNSTAVKNVSNFVHRRRNYRIYDYIFGNTGQLLFFPRYVVMFNRYHVGNRFGEVGKVKHIVHFVGLTALAESDLVRGASNCKSASVVCGKFVVVAGNRSSGNIRTGIDDIAVVSNVNDNRIAAAQICCTCSKRLLRVTRVRSRLFADKFYLQFALFNCQRRRHVRQLLEVGVAADKFCRNGVRTGVGLAVTLVHNSNAMRQVAFDCQGMRRAVIRHSAAIKSYALHLILRNG